MFYTTLGPGHGHTFVAIFFGLLQNLILIMHFGHTSFFTLLVLLACVGSTLALLFCDTESGHGHMYLGTFYTIVWVIGSGKAGLT